MRNRLLAFVGMFVLMTTGCLYNGGSPYGYYGPGPTVMPGQPGMGYPNYNPNPVGTPYIPSNQPPLGQPLGQPTPMDPTSTPPTYRDDGTTAPPFNPRGPAGGVPEPSDPADGTDNSGSNVPGLTPTSNKSRKSAAGDDLSTQSEQGASTRLPRDFANDSATVVEAEPEFHSPVQQVSHESDIEIPYGHSDQFDWLQGYVEYDDPTRSWVIIYNDNPPPSDKLGGEATLAKDAKLDNLQDGQVVRVEGLFDKSTRDSRGYPLFRIKKLSKLQSR